MRDQVVALNLLTCRPELFGDLLAFVTVHCVTRPMIRLDAVMP